MNIYWRKFSFQMWFQTRRTSLKRSNKPPPLRLPEHILTTHAEPSPAQPLGMMFGLSATASSDQIVMLTRAPSPSPVRMAKSVGNHHRAQSWPRSQVWYRDNAPQSMPAPCRFSVLQQTTSSHVTRPRCSPVMPPPSPASLLQCNEVLAVRTTPKDSLPKTFTYNVPIVQPIFPDYNISLPELQLPSMTPTSAPVCNQTIPVKLQKPGPVTAPPVLPPPIFKTPLPPRSHSPDLHLEVLVQQESWLLDLPPTPTSPISASKLLSLTDPSFDSVDKCFTSPNAVMTDLFPNGSPVLPLSSHLHLTTDSNHSVSDIFCSTPRPSSSIDRSSSPEGGPGSSPLRSSNSTEVSPQNSFTCPPVDSSTPITTPSADQQSVSFMVSTGQRSETRLPSFHKTFASMEV